MTIGELIMAIFPHWSVNHLLILTLQIYIFFQNQLSLSNESLHHYVFVLLFYPITSVVNYFITLVRLGFVGNQTVGLNILIKLLTQHLS